jgi:hypothetical protein
VVTDKTLDDIWAEMPRRQLLIGEYSKTEPPRYRRVDLDTLLGLAPFILMELDPGEDGEDVEAVTWWPGGMLSAEPQRGPPMDPALMFLEVKLLTAINGVERVAVTMAPELQWSSQWAELVAD